MRKNGVKCLQIASFFVTKSTIPAWLHWGFATSAANSYGGGKNESQGGSQYIPLHGVLTQHLETGNPGLKALNPAAVPAGHQSLGQS